DTEGLTTSVDPAGDDGPPPPGSGPPTEVWGTEAEGGTSPATAGPETEADPEGTLPWGAPSFGGHGLVASVADQDGGRVERYQLTRLHAKGGIGQVWLARDASLGREVALKELRPERAANPDVWARFLAEARITGQLEHPGIVPVYEMSRREADGRPFF